MFMNKLFKGSFSEHLRDEVEITGARIGSPIMWRHRHHFPVLGGQGSPGGSETRSVRQGGQDCSLVSAAVD